MEVKWTKETCFEEAQKYKTRIEFQIYNATAYHKARINNWLNDYIWFIPKPNIKWTKETCLEESKKYKTISDFRKNNRSAYQIAKKNNWLSDYTWLQKRFTLTKETCFEIALKYKTIKEFRTKNASVYTKASKEGWLKDYIWLDRLNKCVGYWTEEKVKEIALKYTTISEFRKNNPMVYEVARQKKWLEKYEWLKYKKRSHLSKKEVFEFSLKYKTASEFRQNEPYKYSVARKNDWLKEMTWLAPIVRLKWTKETCFEEAQKYKTLKDFIDKNNVAYNVARKKNWINDYIWLEHKKRWTKEEFVEIAKQYTTKAEFREKQKNLYAIGYRHGWLQYLNDIYYKTNWDRGEEPDTIYCYVFESLKSVYVGRTVERRIKARNKEHHKMGSVFNFAISHNVEIPKMEILEICNSVKSGTIKENEYIEKYKSRGYNIINKAQTGLGKSSVGSLVNCTYNYDVCYKAAIKYKTTTEFNKKSHREYIASQKKGWLKDYTWLERPHRWDEQNCLLAYKQCSSLSEFKRKFRGAYNAVLRNNYKNII